MITVITVISFFISTVIPIIFCRIAQTGTFYSVFDYTKHITVFTNPDFRTKFIPIIKLAIVLALFHIVFVIFTGGLGIVLYPVTVFMSGLILTYKYTELFIQVTGMNPDIDEHIPDNQIDEVRSILANQDSDMSEDT